MTSAQNLKKLPRFCPWKHTIDFKKSEILHQKVHTSVSEESSPLCSQNVCTGPPPPPPPARRPGRPPFLMQKNLKSCIISMES